MGNGSSAYPTSVDAISRIQDGVDYIEETDPNDAYATVEATQAFLGASGASQAHNTTVLKQIRAIKPEIVLSYKDTSELYASLGSIVCSNASGSIIKLRNNTAQTTIAPSLGADTQYYVYAVADATATTVTFEVGTSATVAPTATTYRLVGRFKTNSSSEIIEDSILSEATNNINLEKQVIRAWLRLDMSTASPTILDSFNVDSVTDVSTGKFIINWSVEFASVDYCVMGTGYGEDGVATALFIGAEDEASQTTTSIKMRAEDHQGSVVDGKQLNIIAIGEIV